MTKQLVKYMSVFIACMAISTSAHGQTKILSLDNCRTLAIENNISMKKSKADIDQARDSKKEAFTKYFPDLSATGMAFGANKGLMEMDMGPAGSMSMMKNGVMGGIMLAQPVFVGGQIINSNKLAELGITVSELKSYQTRNEVLLTTEQYFWQLVSLREKEKTLEAMKAMLDTINRNVEVAVQAGLKYKNDLLEVQLKRNEIVSGLMNLRNGHSICKMLLSQYIGLNDDNWDIEELSFEYSLPNNPEEIYRNAEDVIEATPEYRLLSANVKAQKLQYKLEVGKNLPSVSIGGGYMFDNLMESRTFLAGFVNVSIPISGWWGGSYSMKKQKTAISKAEMDLEDNSQLLKLRAKSNWNDLMNSYNQIALSISAIGQAKENLRLHEDRYKVGTISMSNLLEAQTTYQQCCEKYIDNYADYCIKKVQYLQSTGR